jgi:hypothetical protein
MKIRWTFTLSPPRQVPAAGHARHFDDASVCLALDPLPSYNGLIEYVPGLQKTHSPRRASPNAPVFFEESASNIKTYPLGQMRTPFSIGSCLVMDLWQASQTHFCNFSRRMMHNTSNHTCHHSDLLSLYNLYG